MFFERSGTMNSSLENRERSQRGSLFQYQRLSRSPTTSSCSIMDTVVDIRYGYVRAKIRLSNCQDIGRVYGDWFIGGDDFCGTRNDNHITSKSDMYSMCQC